METNTLTQEVSVITNTLTNQKRLILTWISLFWSVNDPKIKDSLGNL